MIRSAEVQIPSASLASLVGSGSVVAGVERFMLQRLSQGLPLPLSINVSSLVVRSFGEFS